jgi:DNA repair exonuclease SbcCD ATPase subunit
MRAFGCGITAVKRSVWFAAALLLFLLAAPVQPVHAAPDAVTPIEEFSRELDKLKKSFGDLSRKMEDSAKAIDGYTDSQKTRKEIDELRDAVAGLLDAVADNGSLATLGDKALRRTRDKLKELEQDSRFKPSERSFLIDQWRRIRDDTERATQELTGARTRFAELLRTLQDNEDFIDELLQIRQAEKVVDIIQQLSRDIRGASDQLQRLIGAIKAPGA